MEYLFVAGFLKDPEGFRDMMWTDQMKVFWWDIVGAKLNDGGLGSQEAVANAVKLVRKYGDLTDIEHLKLPRFVVLRSGGMVIDPNQVDAVLSSRLTFN